MSTGDILLLVGILWFAMSLAYWFGWRAGERQEVVRQLLEDRRAFVAQNTTTNENERGD